MQPLIYTILAACSIAQVGERPPSPPLGQAIQVPKEMRDIVYRDVTLTDPDFASSTKISAVECENCDFAIMQDIRGLDVNNLILRDCSMYELLIVGGNLTNVTLDNCKIRYLQIQDSCLKSITMKDCTIDELVLTNLRCASDLEYQGCTFKKFRIDSTERIEDLVFSKTTIEHFEAVRCGFVRPDFSDEKLDPTNFDLHEVRLVQPKLTANFVENLDIRRLVVSPRDFVLKQEIRADSGKHGRTYEKELLREARGVYTVLEQKFAAAGMGRASRWCTYRKGVVERKLNDSATANLLGYVWDQEIRGHYGTSPWVVLRAGFVVSILFTFVYVLLGYARLAWGVMLPASAMGKETGHQVPRLISRETAGTFLNYVRLCFGFSLNQLLLVGTRAFSIEVVADSLRMTDWRYAKVGIGRFVGLVENLVGLALIIFFAQAFVRVL